MSLVRSNKVTAYWKGEHVAVGVFYKTHDKLKEVLSTDAEVVTAGFTMPEGTEEQPVTAGDKLAAFKNFLMANASAFGIQYDPVDRRADEFKFPNKYNDENLLEYSKKMAETAIAKTIAKVNNNVVPSLIKNAGLAEGSEVNYGVADKAEISIEESYNNGNIKYATVKYGVALQVGENTVNTSVTVGVVSGQLRKPRELADGIALTQTGIKEYLIENGLLPKVEKPAKEDTAEEVTSEDGATQDTTEDTAPADAE